MAARSRMWLSRSILVIVVALVLLPLVYQLGFSLKPPGTFYTCPLCPLGFPLSLANYAKVLHDLPMDRYLFNSVAFALLVALGQIALSVPAAYAFSYLRFPLRGALFNLVLLSLMVPFVVTYLPNYLLLAHWHLLNTMAGLVIPMLASGYGIFFLRQHFKSFPKSVLEAAQIDGATGWQALWKVLVPANRAAILTIFIYIFINTWNEFIWPLLVANTPSAYTLTVAVQRYAGGGEGGTDWGALMAVSTLATLPTAVLYLLMYRGVLKTFSEGALKG